MTKKILIGMLSTITIASSSVGGWALVNYYQQNVKTPREHLDLAIEKRIIPLLDEQMNNFSAEWVALNSLNENFVFSTVEGYDSTLEYNVAHKEAVGQRINIRVEVTAQNLPTESYEVTLPNVFSTPESSATLVIQETIKILQKNINNIDVTTLPTPGSTVTPETITINSPEFSKNAEGAFVINAIGSNIRAMKTLDLHSTEQQITDFVNYYVTISQNVVDLVQFREEILINIKNQNTIILFEIQDNLLPSFLDGTIAIKDFTNLDSSNFIENAPELRVVLNNPNYPPTAQEVIESINNNNPSKHLIFEGMASTTSNFRYDIVSATVLEGDIKEESLEITVTVTQTLNQDKKTYTTFLSQLLSVQQNDLNNIIENIEYSQWALKPRIADAYLNKSILEIIESPNLEAFEFIASELERFSQYDYSFEKPQQISLASKSAISIYVEMVHKENSDVKYGYYVYITEGFSVVNISETSLNIIDES